MSVTPTFRPRRTTFHLGLPVPGDEDPADGPGDIGALADAIDALQAGGRLGYATGDLRLSAAQTPPTGWLMCNGQAVDRDIFADLFAVIGTAFGPGNGTTTFNVPDLRDRFPMGAGSPAAVGSRGGANEVILNSNQMPSHSHTGSAAAWSGTSGTQAAFNTTSNDTPDHNHGYGVPVQGSHGVNMWTSGNGHWGAPGVGWTGGYNTGGRNQNSVHAHTVPAHSHTLPAHTHAVTINAAGGGLPHENRPQFVGVNYMIKT